METKQTASLREFYKMISPHIIGHRTASALFWDAIHEIESHNNTTPSPVEGEKEEPREREFRITKNYEDGTSEVTCLRINGEKWVKESDQASRIKALEEQLAFEIRVANAQTEIAKELAQEKEALEEDVKYWSKRAN